MEQLPSHKLSYSTYFQCVLGTFLGTGLNKISTPAFEKIKFQWEKTDKKRLEEEGWASRRGNNHLTQAVKVLTLTSLPHAPE